MSQIFDYVPKDLETKLVERLSALADVKYMFLYLLTYSYIFGFYNSNTYYVFFEKKMHSLASNNRHLTQHLARVF